MLPGSIVGRPVLSALACMIVWPLAKDVAGSKRVMATTQRHIVRRNIVCAKLPKFGMLIANCISIPLIHQILCSKFICSHEEYIRQEANLLAITASFSNISLHPGNAQKQRFGNASCAILSSS